MDIDVEELKKAAPIVDYIKMYYSDIIELVFENDSIAKTNCIWHEDNKSPSLTFFKNTNTYMCFGCGEQGDLINFVRKVDNLTFQEACIQIGNNIGYSVSLTPQNPYYEAYKNIMDNHCRRYWYNYQMNYEAKDYMQNKRGIKKSILDLFRIGVTDKEEYLYRKEIGGICNRITFPILEPKPVKAKCLGIGYRTLNNENPKYINDMNQDGSKNKDPNIAGVFIKGNCLYGYTQAYNYIKKYNHVILTEGYMDVLSMYQSGMMNTVASMGTSITKNQIDLIKKLTKNVILIMDSDKAGINSMKKILPLLFENELNTKICILDKGCDPADLCLNHSFNSKKVYKVIKENTIDAVNFLINDCIQEYESYVISKRKEILNTLQPVLSNMTDIEKRVCTDMLYKRLDIGGI